MEIKHLGYDSFFESNRKKLKLDIYQVARVIAEHRGAYKVKNADGEYLARITGKQMFEAVSREDFPAVGDWVAIEIADEENAVIRGVLPRKTILKKKYSGKNETQVIAANIDVAFVIESVDRDYNLNRFERYFSLARDSGIKPAIILNKTDLATKDDLDLKLTQIKNRFNNIDFIPTSIVNKDGLDKLNAYILEGKTYCFLGSSGVGKSSLINQLLERDIIRTGDISLRTNKGKHTTTVREMYFLANGGIVIDNPGMREVGMTDTDSGIDDLFEEITELASGCKYADCTHTQEPGCRVLAALNAGKIDKGKYANYLNLKKEVGYYKMTDLEKRQKDRDFGKFIKTTKKQLKKLDH